MKNKKIILIILSILLLVVIVFYIYNYLINEPPFPIDIVYTWKGEDINDDIRTSFNYELKYSLRSVELFAPWVNKIYILTNEPNTYPSWINKSNNKIIMINHTQTFPQPQSLYLPNKNSNAIETTIANIPNLSEHYIYFNDDVFLGNKTKYTDFFTRDGKAYVDKECKKTQNIQKDIKFNVLNIEYPDNVNSLYVHIPIPLLKSVVLEFNNKYSRYINWIRMTKTRNKRGYDICEKYQLNSPCQQIHFPIGKYMLYKNKATLKNYDDPRIQIYVGNSKRDIDKKFYELILKKPLFFCINDSEEDVKKKKKIRKKMLNFFNYYFKKKATFEL
uniref:Stealth protein CR2 conserved region 2 domain-containing protein n=1 Tax=viral metagenome TaxID=1070528 RepID=A0A6C0D9K4_9ZZZZ